MPPINTARRSITFVFLLTFRVLFRCSADYGTLQLHLQSDKSTANRIAGFPRKAAKGLTVSMVSLKTKFEKSVHDRGAQP